MNAVEYFKQRFDRLQSTNGKSNLTALQQKAFHAFEEKGIPTLKNEEWKYTRISPLFNKEYELPFSIETSAVTKEDIDPFRLPGHEEANELVFINGIFSLSLSFIRSAELVVLPLEEAAKNEYSKIVAAHLGHSSEYHKDGINALNTAFANGGVFIYIKKNIAIEHPVYIYNITDARTVNIFSQPRSLVYVSENAQVEIVEKYKTIGRGESFTNQVMEVVVDRDARVEYYKIQNDAGHASQVSTTHIRQIGKSHTHAVTISLNGSIIRNNLNVILEAERSEAHLYGLYFQQGKSHIDNHTVVDNIKPNCFSNELYKGVLSDQSNAVFNGKIFVKPQAQKTNAYQSNKNILLSADAGVNTKPQLEIFADDVKCSHGCTVGQLDEEGMFYLRSRGIPEEAAKSLLVHSFVVDILEKIKPAAIRNYVDKLISERLEFDVS